MKKWLIVVTVIIATLPIYAQRNAMETNTWLLSSAFPRCGIDFSSGRGEAFSENHPSYISELLGRSVTISDPRTGKFLFLVGHDIASDTLLNAPLYLQTYRGRVLREIMPGVSARLNDSHYYYSSPADSFYWSYSDVCVVPDVADSSSYYIIASSARSLVYSHIRLGNYYRNWLEDSDIEFITLREPLLKNNALGGRCSYH